MDRLTPAKRSWLMSRVRSVDTKPELAVRRIIHGLGFRFRLHRRDLPGCPDLVLPRYRAVVFVHGCFWHRHPGCRMATKPKSNTVFWTRKFRMNVARDKRAKVELELAGWNVLTVWECETRNAARIIEVVKKFLKTVKVRRKANRKNAAVASKSSRKPR